MPRLCVIPGDGIGREVVPVAVAALQAVVPDLDLFQADAGWDCFERTGHSVPTETLAAIRDCGAALFGAVQSPTFKVEGYKSAILTMRQELGLYANIRPVRSLPAVSPRPDVDLIVVRENSEGLYSQRESISAGRAVAERIITVSASRRIAQRTVELMERLGRQRLTIVHKANVLPLTDGLFRDSVREIVGERVEVDELLVDVAALKMVAEPNWFDTIVTTNLFGDILSDAAAHWGGGLGYAPSLNWGADVAIAEPVHGSAPDIAGQQLANPLAAVLSAALLARYHWSLPAVADKLEAAVSQLLSSPELIGALLEPAPGLTKKIQDRLLACL